MLFCMLFVGINTPGQELIQRVNPKSAQPLRGAAAEEFFGPVRALPCFRLPPKPLRRAQAPVRPPIQPPTEGQTQILHSRR